jgi:hypothetical protein
MNLLETSRSSATYKMSTGVFKLLRSSRSHNSFLERLNMKIRPLHWTTILLASVGILIGIGLGEGIIGGGLGGVVGGLLGLIVAALIYLSDWLSSR